jgi:putative transposase
MQTYPTDLTQTEYALLEPHLPPLEPHPRRCWHYPILLNAMFYLVDNGIKWRAMPHDFPPGGTVYGYWREWVKTGLWERLNAVLREQVRTASGREAQPSAGCLDSQSTKTSECAAERGFDGAKKLNGRKRFILTDTLGLVLKVHITPANLKETDGGRDLLERLDGTFSRMKHVWVDQGFSFWAFSCWVLGALGWTVEVTGKSQVRPGSEDFKPVARRWVVERTFAWVTRCRRLVRDFERLSETVEALIYACMTRLMLRRLVKDA